MFVFSPEDAEAFFCKFGFKRIPIGWVNEEIKDRGLRGSTDEDEIIVMKLDLLRK